MDEVLTDILQNQTRLRPTKICLVDGPIRLSFKEIDVASGYLADWLLSLGIAKGDVVGIQLPNWYEFLLAFLAVGKIGAAATLIPVSFRASEIRVALALTRPRAIVVPRSFRGFDFPAMYASVSQGIGPAQLLVVDNDAAPGTHYLGRFGCPTPDDASTVRARSDRHAVPDDPCLIFFTSGSEGDSKAALHSHRTFLHTVKPLVPVLELTDQDVSLVISPLSTPAGMAASTLAEWSEGGTVILEEHFEAEKALQVVSKENVTVLAGSPAHFELLLDCANAQARMGSLRVVRLTGAFAPPQLVIRIRDTIGCRVAVGYGMTEIGLLTGTRSDDPVEVTCHTIGRPVPGMEAGIFDEEGDRLGVGQIGQIAARGPAVFVGYRGREGPSEGTGPDGWLFTGDLGFVDEAGNLHFVGRRKELINRGGMKISPLEVEKILLEHPKVESAAVVAMPDPILGERSCAYVVPRPSQTVTLEELVDFLKHKGLATFKLPERLELAETLPLTGNLKVAKEALRRDVAEKLNKERR